MGSFSNWTKNGNEGLSQKVFGRVKPETPIKNKIENAQQKLELQIMKLSGISAKIQKKHDHMFEKIVNAQKSNNHSYAKAYAIEIQEIRKMINDYFFEEHVPQEKLPKTKFETILEEDLISENETAEDKP